MKTRLILLLTIFIIAGSLVSWMLYHRQQAVAGNIPIQVDDPTIIDRVTVDEASDVIEKIARNKVYLTNRLEDVWSELYQPRGVKIVNDRMYILDAGNNRVAVFDSQGNFIHQIGGVGQGPGEFIQPWNFAVSRTGEVCVLTVDGAQRHSIHTFDRQGQFEQKFKLDFRPEGLAINSRREILLSAPDQQAIIKVYSFDGRLLRRFGSPLSVAEAKGDTKLLRVYNEGHLYLDKEDNLYMAFACSPLIRAYRSDGKLVRQIKVSGREINQLIDRQTKAGTRPHLTSDGKKVSRANLLQDLAVDTSGNVFLSLGGQYLYVYDPSGSLKQVMDVEDPARGPLAIHRLALDSRDRLHGLNLITGMYIF